MCKILIVVAGVLCFCIAGLGQQKVGIGTAIPQAMLHVANGSVLFSAPSTLPATPENPPVIGIGNRMMYYADKSAFRVGGIASGYANHWDKDSIGLYSFAAGFNVKATDDFGVAFGSGSQAAGIGALAVGVNSWATQYCAVALGSESVATGPHAITLGRRNVASGISAISLGWFTEASGDYAMSWGRSSKASGDYSLSLGYETESKGISSLSAGNLSNASGDYSIAMGLSATALGNNSIALGNLSNSSGLYSAAIGREAIAAGNYSVAIGHNTRATRSYATSFGLGTISNAFGSMAIGTYNDTLPAIANFIYDFDPAFMIGNGKSNTNRSNAMTVLFNGNVGIGTMEPLAKMHLRGAGVNNQMILENSVTNSTLRLSNDGGAGGAYAGTTSNHAFSLVSNNAVRAVITNNGTIDVKNNLTVQNGKGIIRNADDIQQKKLTTTVTVSGGFNAGETKTFGITWPESFGGAPDAFVGNIVSGTGGWAEMTLTITSATAGGAILYVYNSQNNAVNPNFTIKIIGIGPQ